MSTTSRAAQLGDLGYEVVTTDQMLDAGIEALARRILQKLRGRKVFLSFDLDVVDPAFAPGVQTPEAGGPSGRDLLRLIRQPAAWIWPGPTSWR